LKKIIIINCGGNILSLTRAIKKFENNFLVTSDLKEIKNATHIFLPGVGAFKKAMKILNEKNLKNLLQELDYNKVKLMGICLGMQLLFDKSNENGIESGLGLIKGNIKKIQLNDEDKQNKLKIPNVGWHEILIKNESNIFNGMTKKFQCYFVHSFHAKLIEPKECLAEIQYGSSYLTAVVKKDNIYGCQFHPEKSGLEGLKIIKNFLEIS
jgi:glutamine amidotransferase